MLRKMLCLAAWLASSATSSAEPQPWPEMRSPDVARLKAHTLCSCLFVQQMSAAQCADGRSAIWRYPFPGVPPRLVSPGQRVVAAIEADGGFVQILEHGKPIAESRYIDDGGGCTTIEPGQTLAFVRGRAVRSVASGQEITALPRAPLPGAVDSQAFGRLLEEGFAIAGPLTGYARAAIVVHNDHVVAEKYAPGFGSHNQYYLGSIAKVFNNLLAGLLVREGKLQVADAVALPEWQAAADRRAAITFDQMLHMTSGLDWADDFFTPGAPAYNIYFGGPSSLDVARYVSARPLEAEPGTQYEYSTGASTLLAAALQARLDEKGREALLRYFSRNLFEPLGMSGTTVEFDAAGTFLAGHSVFARAEDLARTGLLFLHEGRWQERQLLPTGWLAYSTKPAKGANAGSGYGAHLMLDMLGLPGCFGHSGVGGQRLIVCPKRRLVVAWLSSAFDFAHESTADPDQLLRRLVLAFPE